MGKSQTKAKNKYNAKAYDRISVTVKKGMKDEWKSEAEKKGLSLNAFIEKAVNQMMTSDNCTNYSCETSDSDTEILNAQEEIITAPSENEILDDVILKIVDSCQKILSAHLQLIDLFHYDETDDDSGEIKSPYKEFIKEYLLTIISEDIYRISILDKNEQAVNDNTAELEKLNNQLSGKSDAVDSNTPTYNNKNLDTEGYLIGTDGKRVLNDGKPIHAKNFSDEIAKRNTSKKMTDVVKGIGKFAGYDTMQDLIDAMITGEYTIPTSTANSMMNSNINSRIGRDITKVPEYVNNVVNNNNAPVINQTFNVEGSMDEKTVNAVDDKINKHLIDYTDKLISQISVSSLRRQNKS